MMSNKIRLRELREERNLSQAQLARETDMNKRVISHYEANERKLTVEAIDKFCKFFNVSADYFLGFKDE